MTSNTLHWKDLHKTNTNSLFRFLFPTRINISNAFDGVISLLETTHLWQREYEGIITTMSLSSQPEMEGVETFSRDALLPNFSDRPHFKFCKGFLEMKCQIRLKRRRIQSDRDLYQLRPFRYRAIRGPSHNDHHIRGKTNSDIGSP